MRKGGLWEGVRRQQEGKACGLPSHGVPSHWRQPLARDWGSVHGISRCPPQTAHTAGAPSSVRDSLGTQGEPHPLPLRPPLVELIFLNSTVFLRKDKVREVGQSSAERWPWGSPCWFCRNLQLLCRPVPPARGGPAAGHAPEAVALGDVQRCPPYRVSGVLLGRNPVRLTPLCPTRRKAAGTQYNVCQVPGCRWPHDLMRLLF